MPGVPVIYDGNDPEAAQVIRRQAEDLGSPFYEVKKTDSQILRNTRAGIDFSVDNEYYENTVFSIPIRRQAEDLGSPFYEVKKTDSQILRNTRAGIDFSVDNEYYENTVFSIPFIAGYLEARFMR